MTELLYKEEAYAIVGACMEVHRELGHGFLEPVYQEALEIELGFRRIPFSREVELGVRYKNELLKKKYFADFVCNDKILVELKAVKDLLPEHEAQIFNYLKATGLQLGLLVNFGQSSLQYKRIACSRNFRNPNSPNPPNSRL
jgi:GxxExxY protein